MRDLHGGGLLDLFFVSAVASVLAIRFYLELAGYPQVGGATLHIAHMLWGGLLMMAGLVIVLVFLGRAARRWAALLGGVGFGTFIDEVGKFVTRDHDYFFRPAIAIMYVVFVAIYVAGRSVRRRGVRSREEYVVNALQELEEAALHDLQRDEQERALRYLELATPPTPLTTRLAAALHELDVAPSRRPGLLARGASAALRAYRALAVQPRFWKAVVAFFVAQLAVKLFHATLVFVRGGGTPERAGPGVAEPGSSAALAAFGLDLQVAHLPDWLQLGSSLVSAAFVAAGVIAARASRRRALGHFRRSLLVSVFVTQVFMFYSAQWAALAVLAFNLLLLAALGYMEAHETEPRS